MKRLLTAIALAIALSVSALGGDIPTSGVPSPAPSGTTQSTASTSPGEIPSGGSAEQISDAALSTLLSVLSFLAA